MPTTIPINPTATTTAAMLTKHTYKHWIVAEQLSSISLYRHFFPFFLCCYCCCCCLYLCVFLLLCILSILFNRTVEFIISTKVCRALRINEWFSSLQSIRALSFIRLRFCSVLLSKINRSKENIQNIPYEI